MQMIKHHYIYIQQRKCSGHDGARIQADGRALFQCCQSGNQFDSGEKTQQAECQTEGNYDFDALAQHAEYLNANGRTTQKSCCDHNGKQNKGQQISGQQRDGQAGNQASGTTADGDRYNAA